MYNIDFWNNPIHRSFVEGLDGAQLKALWELLLVATFADDELTIGERRALADSLRGLPEFSAHDLAESAEELERVYSRYESRRSEFLADITTRLGTDAAKRGAFRTAVQLVKSDGLVESEKVFVSELGELMGLEQEVVQFAITDSP